jgi:outer membrane receptor protein involved in Fe transport
MALRRNPLSNSVSLALALGLAGTTAPVVVLAQDQDRDDATELETIVVTGSRIRRVDAETASPVFVLDRDDIERTGAPTVGDFLQDFPAISGGATATSPQVNNGGGTGASTVDLRGLGVNRTLVLLNGRRVVTTNGGSTSLGGVDVNLIPLAMVERIEVLKDGASAIYGSDAIGGVVNFILKDEYDGFEISGGYGVTSEDDGAREDVSVTFGHTGERGSIALGLTYNQQDGVLARDRAYAASALYLSSGSVFAGGSSRTPTGRIFLPANLTGRYGCGDVTRIAGRSGASLDDYRCFVSSGPNNDRYNFQAVGNLLITPQERASLFTTGNYEISDEISAYFEGFYNQTQAGYAIAPLPFDARSDGVFVSRNSLYNPFGADMDNVLVRLEALGNRRAEADTVTSQIATGLRGAIGDSSWTWDAGVIWGNIDQDNRTFGYIYQPALQNALGPSFRDSAGAARCGTPAAPIAGCVPINIFNLSTPEQIAALQTIAANPASELVSNLKSATINATGSVFDLPAGTMSAAVGAEYREHSLKFEPDFLTIALPPDFTTCFLSQETCTGATDGEYDVTEVYGELFIPLLTEAPLTYSLNGTLGWRWSDYSNFGSTDNFKIGLEWRPIEDLLVRSTYAEVFRAPNISDLFAPEAAGAPTVIDPCNGLTTPVGVNANIDAACRNVPRDGSFQQNNGQYTGIARGNEDLEAETGDVWTIGLVYDPSWLEGSSFNLDYFRVQLEDAIEVPAAGTILNACFTGGLFCQEIRRFSDGQVNFIGLPTLNLGDVDARGVDVGFQYRLPETNFGQFRYGLNATYIERFTREILAGVPGGTLYNAGVYNAQDGLFPRWKALSTLDWRWGNWGASWTARYIHRFSLGSDLIGGPSADGAIPNVVLDYGSTTYHNLEGSWTYEPWKTTIRVGVDNVNDKGPPILYQNNVTNANTDVVSFDTIGRFYWVRFSVAF